MLRGYLATHFFNNAGLNWTKDVASLIRRNSNIDLYVPHENASINNKSGDDSHITAQSIAEGDNKYLRESNILIASLDGVEIDSGVSAEIGYFSGLIESEQRLVASPRFRFIIGLYTDMRRNGSGDNHFYINLYTKGLVQLNGLVIDISELPKTIQVLENLVKIQSQIKGRI